MIFFNLIELRKSQGSVIHWQNTEEEDKTAGY